MSLQARVEVNAACKYICKYISTFLKLAKEDFSCVETMAEILTALDPLFLTLKAASGATIFSFLAGVILAGLMSRWGFPGKDWLDAIMTLPLVLPPTVLGYYLIVLLGRKGWLGQFLLESFGISLMFTWQGAVIASAVVSFPLIFDAKAGINLPSRARKLGYLFKDYALFQHMTVGENVG
jgi:ABC-type sulfate transport system permease component